VIYDISVLVHDQMAVWPSDPPARLERSRHTGRDGAHDIRITSIRCGSHTGTHLDAPSHMMDGPTLSEIPLEDLIGPTRVLALPGRRAIDRSDLERMEWAGVERVLFKTDNSGHWGDLGFHEDFVYLEPDGARFLVERRIRLVGIDYLSIDAYESVDHASHLVLLAASVVILEGIDLSSVPEGDYELIALPMKLDRTDGAPVRAVLRN
jgi:arylformamidase